MVATVDLEMAVIGSWAVHPERTTVLGAERFRRWPTRYVVFGESGWRLYETGRRRRLKHAGISQGHWRIVDLDGRALLMLVVESYRSSAASRVMLESNYGYSGGAMIVIGAHAARDNEARKMLDREARMYFLAVHLEPNAVIMALPSSGGRTPRQRWVRDGGVESSR